MPAKPVLDEKKLERIKHLKSQGWSNVRIGKDVGCSAALVSNVTTGASDYYQAEDSEGWTEEENAAKWTGITSKPVKTEKELLKVCEVDLSIWYVKRWGCRAWTVWRCAGGSVP